MSLTELGQIKPAGQVLGSSARNQMRFTFETASQTNRAVVYGFKGGAPSQEWLSKLSQYSSEYGVSFRVIVL